MIFLFRYYPPHRNIHSTTVLVSRRTVHMWRWFHGWYLLFIQTNQASVGHVGCTKQWCNKEHTAQVWNWTPPPQKKKRFKKNKNKNNKNKKQTAFYDSVPSAWAISLCICMSDATWVLQEKTQEGLKITREKYFLLALRFRIIIIIRSRKANLWFTNIIPVDNGRHCVALNLNLNSGCEELFWFGFAQTSWCRQDHPLHKKFLEAAN